VKKRAVHNPGRGQSKLKEHGDSVQEMLRRPDPLTDGIDGRPRERRLAERHLSAMIAHGAKMRPVIM
jgi:hypothetical protein